MISIQIDGMKQIQNQLNGLGKAVGPILRRSAQATGKVLQDAIQAATPVAMDSRTVKGQRVSPGLLRSAIGMTVTQQDDRSYQLNVGINVGRQKVASGSTPIRGKSQAYYGIFLALNTPDRWTGERTRMRTVGGVKTRTKEKTGKRRMFRGRVVGFQWVAQAVAGAATPAAQAGKAAMDAGVQKALTGATL